MLYVSNNFSPNMLDMPATMEFFRVGYKESKSVLENSGEVRIPKLGEWPRRIVSEGLRLDIPPQECHRFKLAPGDEMLIVKYAGKSEWKSLLEPAQFRYYRCRVR